MLSVDEARRLITADLPAVDGETVDLAAAAGRVLTEDVAARRTQPPVAISAMDGYAVRGVDVARVPTVLRLLGESAAGHGFGGTVGAGEAVRILTGAALPAGADCIVIQENAEPTGDGVRIREVGSPGRWIRPAGLDFSEGDVLLKAGRRLTWRDLGLAAAMNLPGLRVRRKPVIACLATGDELVRLGDPLRPEAVVNANSVAFMAAVEAFGGKPLDLGIVGDDVATFGAAVDGAADADLLVTFGGASVGAHDVVRQAFEGDGFAVDFHRIAMRPGKPLIFGHRGALPVLGLPGNPVSVGVTTILFVRAAIHALLGLPVSAPPTQPAILTRGLPANDAREDYLRGRLSEDAGGTALVTAFDKQDSSMLAAFAAADCLIVRPPNAPPALAGEPVPVIVFNAPDTAGAARIVETELFQQ